MADPTIICPNCKSEIKLTESLAAPIIEATRKDYERRLAEQASNLANREASLLSQQKLVEEERRSISEQVAAQVKQERATVIAEEIKKAKAAAEAELHNRDEKLVDLQMALEQKEVRLQEAQKAQAELIRKERELQDAKREFDLTVEQRVQDSLGAIREKVRLESEVELALRVSQEAEKLQRAAAAELDQRDRRLAEMQEIVEARGAKLEEAQKAQADLLRKQRELDDAMRELNLTVEQRVQASLGEVREKAKSEAEEGLKLKVAEREEQISSMQKQIDALKRKAEQGSQQLQGEVLELSLETTLRAKFPTDAIEPVGKGEAGGDVLQRVVGLIGQSCGSILWEFKRTKNWSEGWLSKLRDDQRYANAEVAVLVSSTLPKNVETFGLVDGIWVAEPRVAIPLAVALRHALIEVSNARQAGQGQQTKMALVYQYLTSQKFRHRVEAIVEKIADMQADLEKERKTMLRLWAKREAQIQGVIESTVGMYGDLQGIAGQAIQEIESLQPLLIDQA